MAEECHYFEINMADDPLAMARLSLSLGSPMHIRLSTGESYVITPWQHYSKLYKERYGEYPEMWGYPTLKDESEERHEY